MMSSDWFLSDEDSELFLRYERSVREHRNVYFDAEEIARIVDYNLMRKDLETCQNALDTGFRLHPDSALLQAVQAGVCCERGEYLEALELVRKSLKVEKNSDSFFVEGKTLLKLNRKEEAWQAFRTALAVDDCKTRVDFITNVADLLLGGNMEKEALEVLESAHVNNPCDYVVMWMLVEVYRTVGRLDDAAGACNRMIDINPYEPTLWIRLGELYMEMGEYEQAARAFDFAYTVDETFGEALVGKGDALSRNGSYRKAIEAYKSAIDHCENPSQIVMLIAECYERMDDYVMAGEYYYKAYQMNSADLDACSGLAVCLMEQDNYSDALKYLQRSVDLCPDDAEVLVYMAECYVNLNLYEEAEKAYRHSLEVNPCQPEVLMSLGSLYLDGNDLGTALQHFLEAENMDADLKGLPAFITIACGFLKYHKVAKYYCRKAMEQDETNMKELINVFKNDIDWKKIL